MPYIRDFMVIWNYSHTSQGPMRYYCIALHSVIRTVGSINWTHDDVIKWKHFPRYCPFVRGIHRSSVNSPHKGQWCGALMFSLISVWIKVSVSNREAGDLRCHHTHYDVIVMLYYDCIKMLHSIFGHLPQCLLLLYYCKFLVHEWEMCDILK